MGTPFRPNAHWKKLNKSIGFTNINSGLAHYARLRSCTWPNWSQPCRKCSYALRPTDCRKFVRTTCKRWSSQKIEINLTFCSASQITHYTSLAKYEVKSSSSWACLARLWATLSSYKLAGHRWISRKHGNFHRSCRSEYLWAEEMAHFTWLVVIFMHLHDLVTRSDSGFLPALTWHSCKLRIWFFLSVPLSLALSAFLSSVLLFPPYAFLTVVWRRNAVRFLSVLPQALFPVRFLLWVQFFAANNSITVQRSWSCVTACVVLVKLKSTHIHTQTLSATR